MAGRILMLLGLGFMLPPSLNAQVPAPPETPAARPDAAIGVVAPRVVPAGTIISIRLEAPVSSRTARNDDMFPISLLTPIELDGEVIVPAGTRGMGQVVHAAPRGFGGRAGELILAARYLQWGDRRIPLRGMRISASGRNNTAEAIALSAALSVAGLFVTGTSVDLQIGHEGIARLSEDLAIDTSETIAATAAAVPTTGENQ